MHIVFDHKERLSPGVWTFHFTAPTIDYIAGQYAEVWIPHEDCDNRGDKRMFSFSSAPHEDFLSISVSFPSPSSSYKNAMMRLSPGTALTLTTPPMGDFILPKDPGVPLVFIAGGVGIAPVRSMIAWLNHVSQQRDIQLIYLAKNSDELLFCDLFTRYPLSFTPLLSRTQNDTAIRYTAKELIAQLGELDRKIFYLSGSESMVQALIDELLLRGVPRSRQVLDIFTGYESLI